MINGNVVALLFVPLMVGVLLNGILGAKFSRRLSGLIGVVAMGLAFLGGILAWSGVRSGRVGDYLLYEWIATKDFTAQIAFKFDPLSAVMILVVTGVSFLIHIYAIGYMSHEDQRGFSRFFAYLNLFVFAMLILVLANNYLLMFVGWEGVGLCSYLLIGFWYDRARKEGESTDPPTAAKKAFVVNRIGDFGFLLGMFFLYTQYGSLKFDTIFSAAEAGVGTALLGTITLLLFVGAVGKSAQIPLYVWLPDAMQGPTPVSALIHAATMVTAGVYMVARSHVLYSLAGTGNVVAWIGAITAIFAATMAITSFDFKGVLAYSTISQLGYMFVAVGLGAYSAGISHLMTHAFFKALLFLCAGSVLHAVHDVGDIRKLGALASKMPITFWTFTVAALALSGFPLLSGFFSKDAILLAAFEQNMTIFIIGLITAGLTAFYIFRLLAIAFAGQSRSPVTTATAHESPPVMTWPLLVLAIAAAGAGILLGFKENGAFYRFLDPVFGHEAEAATGGGFLPMILSILAALIGIVAGFILYRGKSVEELERANPLTALARRKYYVDEIYDLLIVRPIRWTSTTVLWRFIDLWIIDGIVNLTASVIWTSGALLRTFQTGVIQTYAVIVFAGAVVTLLVRALL